MEYEAKFTGFPTHEIREIIECIYGSCVWERLKDGSVVCYPNSSGKIHITSKCSRPQKAAD